MQPSLREDYLEAILIITEKNAHPPRSEELAPVLGRAGSELHADLEELVSGGDVIILTDGTILLTAQGKSTGTSVIKKHETLQCFLSEILGMDSSSAASEACTLEHAISDETIKRLGQLIKTRNRSVQPEQERQRWRGGDGKHREEGEGSAPCPSISDFSEGDTVIISCIRGRACAKRLLDLGLVPGEQVVIKRKLSNGALVVRVKGCAVAVSPEIAGAIGAERSP